MKSPEDEDVQRARRKLSILSDNTLVESLDSVNLDTKEEEATATVIQCIRVSNRLRVLLMILTTRSLEQF